jgi:hypothetical protein
MKLVIATFLLCGAAFAAPVPVAVTAGSSFSIALDGHPTLQTDPPSVGGPVDYLSSVIYFSDFAFFDVGGGLTRLDLQMDVYNTSSAPLTSSLLSVIGFETTPNITGGSVTGAYDTVYRLDSFPGVGIVEFCVTGSLNCAGADLAPGEGVEQGTGETAYASLFFNGAGLTEITIENVFVRYQNLTGVPNVFNGTGYPVPEPGAYLVLAVGLLLTGSVVVRRRRLQAN